MAQVYFQDRGDPCPKRVPVYLTILAKRDPLHRQNRPISEKSPSILALISKRTHYIGKIDPFYIVVGGMAQVYIQERGDAVR